MSKPEPTALSQSQKLSISTLLYRHSPRLLVFAVFIGALAGALYSLIIPFVLRELNAKSALVGQVQSMPWAGAWFFGICILILTTKVCAVILVNNIAKAATADLRLSIAAKISRMQIDQVERIGFSRLLTILNDDVNHVASAAIAIPMVVVSGVSVLGMLAYLASLNLAIFAIVVAAILFGITLFQIPVSMATRLYRRARALRDIIQEGVRGMVLGAYELKLDPAKARGYQEDELVTPQRQSVKLEKVGDMIFHLAGNASELLSFFIIGLIVFVLPKFMSFPVSSNTGVVMALLYIAGPVASILGMMQQLNVGRIAIGRIDEITDTPEEVVPPGKTAELAPWREYRVEGVTYQYPLQDPQQERAFALEPVTLTFVPGQINFIVGGNGSGKSTLSKLLSLHYIPAAGQVYFDQTAIDDANRQQARSRIGVIYSNYFLFKKLYRATTHADTAQINHYLDALGLTGKTEFIDGHFTATRLSDGQRRRLALLVALLEDRDIYIFDEWAADQDPGFKRIFYQEILQDMKRNNKLVIVITHDDRYFDCADRVIFMEDGKMTGQRQAGAALPGAASDTASALPDRAMAG